MRGGSPAGARGLPAGSSPALRRSRESASRPPDTPGLPAPMSPANRPQPRRSLYRERDQFSAGNPAELLWIQYEEPVLCLAVGGEHWYKSSVVVWADRGGRAVQDAAGLPGGQGELQHIQAVP